MHLGVPFGASCTRRAEDGHRRRDGQRCRVARGAARAERAAQLRDARSMACARARVVVQGWRRGWVASSCASRALPSHTEPRRGGTAMPALQAEPRPADRCSSPSSRRACRLRQRGSARRARESIAGRWATACHSCASHDCGRFIGAPCFAMRLRMQPVCVVGARSLGDGFKRCASQPRTAALGRTTCGTAGVDQLLPCAMGFSTGLAQRLLPTRRNRRPGGFFGRPPDYNFDEHRCNRHRAARGFRMYSSNSPGRQLRVVEGAGARHGGGEGGVNSCCNTGRCVDDQSLGLLQRATLVWRAVQALEFVGSGARASPSDQVAAFGGVRGGAVTRRRGLRPPPRWTKRNGRNAANLALLGAAKVDLLIYGRQASSPKLRPETPSSQRTWP